MIEASGKGLSPTVGEMIPDLGEILLSAKLHSLDINTNVDSVILDGGDSLYHKENVKHKDDDSSAQNCLISERSCLNVHPPGLFFPTGRNFPTSGLSHRLEGRCRLHRQNLGARIKMRH